MFYFHRNLTTEHNSNSNDSIDDVPENNLDKRPQYKNIMNNIRRGIRTDDDVAANKRVGILLLINLSTISILFSLL